MTVAEKSSSVKAEKIERDFLSRLSDHPHILNAIFAASRYATLLKAEKVSPLWQHAISMSTVWPQLWHRNKKSIPMWRTLAVRLESLKPELCDQMKNKVRCSHYRAAHIVQSNIQQIFEGEMKRLHRYNIPGLKTEMVRVNEKNVHIYNPTRNEIRVVNRWTFDVVKVLNHRHYFDMQLSERFLAVKLKTDEIIIYDVDNYELIQTIENQNPNYPRPHEFCLADDVLASVSASNSRLGFMLSLRRLNAETGVFPTEPQKNSYFVAETPLLRRHLAIYCDEKFLVLDMYRTNSRKKPMRAFMVFNLRSWRLIRSCSFERCEPLYDRVKRECNSGVIVLDNNTNNTKPQPSLVAWNVGNGTLRPINSSFLPSIATQILYTGAVSHNQQNQYMFRSFVDGKISFSAFSSDNWRDSSRYPNARRMNHAYEHLSGLGLDAYRPGSFLTCHSKIIHFDGAQLIFLGENSDLNIIDYVE